MDSKLFFEHESVFNNYVASHPRGSVLQTTNWGQLKQATGWKYYPLAVMDRGVIQASALILARRAPLLGFWMFYSPRGPLFSSREGLEELLKAVKKLGREKRAVVWKTDPALPADDALWHEFSQEHNFVHLDTGLDFAGIQPRFIMDLDITAPLNTVLENMKSKTRYNIRYAGRKGVKVVRSTDKTDLNIFYAILQETAERDGFTVRGLEYYEYLWDYLIEARLAQLFLAYHEDVPLAGTIAFRLGKRVWYVYGATSNTKRNLQASHLIQWEMIRWAKAFGCTVYDFRGVSGDLNPDNPLYGLYRFKDGFGAQLKEYVGEYDLPLNKVGYMLWQKGLALHNRMRKSRNAK